MTEARRNEIMTGIAVSIVVTVVLYAVPYGHVIGRPLIWLSTFAHEMGHGLAAILTGGTFVKFVMSPDGSGMATSMIQPGGINRAITAAGGLLGPPLVAAALFAVATRPRWSRAALWVMTAGCALSALLVVRNAFGMVFVLLLGATLAALARWASPRAQHFAVLFMAVQMALTVYSRGDYLFTDTAGTGPSDVQQIADALFGPYWLWGGLIAVLSALIVLGGLWIVWRSLRSDGPRRPKRTTTIS